MSHIIESGKRRVRYGPQVSHMLAKSQIVNVMTHVGANRLFTRCMCRHVEVARYFVQFERDFHAAAVRFVYVLFLGAFDGTHFVSAQVVLNVKAENYFYLDYNLI